MRGAWIEISDLDKIAPFHGSLPMRGAWIEIYFTSSYLKPTSVAPHAGSVD